MDVHNSRTVEIEMSNVGFFFKAIVNKNAIAFFPESIQHRNLKTGGLSYEDDYQGNALACIIKPRLIEVRYHALYSDSEVLQMFKNVLAHAELQCLRGFSVSYQGRTIL